MSDSKPDSKVLFRVPNDNGSAEVETLWATALGNDLYRLENSPFYAYSMSWLDVVYAPYDEDEDRPTFQRIAEKSGHKTVRVIFDPPVEDGNESDRVLKKLVNAGCSYEGANPTYIAIDIPSGVDLEDVRQLLIDAEMQWEYADPCYVELYPDDA